MTALHSTIASGKSWTTPLTSTWLATTMSFKSLSILAAPFRYEIMAEASPLICTKNSAFLLPKSS